MANRIKIVLLTLLCCAFVAGCDDFLEEKPEAFRTPDTFFQTEQEIEQGLAGIYRLNRFLHGGDGQLQLRFGEMRSDNTNIEITGDGGGFGDDQLNEFTMDATNGRIAGYWDNNYKGISRANFVLANIEGVAFNDQATKDARIGEALFFRVLFYFNLVRVYGAVPYVVRPGENPDQILSESFVIRTPVADIYRQIIADAERAVGLLPTTTPSPGRVTKGAALMLKAKVHMAQGQYGEARPLLEEITTLGYALLPSYRDVFFTKNHAEGIFEIQYSPALNQGANFFTQFVPTRSGNDLLGPGTNPNSRGNQFQPTSGLIALYADDDQRKAHSISVFRDTTFNDDGSVRQIDEYPWGSKFAFPFDVNQPNQQNINWQMYRYADALLMLAECYNEDGGGDPVPLVEQIRRRAGLADPTLSAAEQADLAQTIADERRRELVFEGHRFFDLLRTGKLVETMAAHGVQQVADGRNVTADAYQNIRTVVGIPQGQVEQFGFDQTQGWE